MSDSNINYRHPAYSEFLPEWQMVGDCVDGERAVKKQREKYLPHPGDEGQNSEQDRERYKAYLKRAPFINATGRTLTGLIGIAFNKPVKIQLSGKLTAIESDADGEGQPLTQLIRDALSQNLQRGRAGILSDYTSGGTQTVATAGRPVIRLFTAKQIINWRVTNNKTSLVVLHYQEPVNDPDSFELIMKDLWLELRLINGLAMSRKWQESDEGIQANEWVELKDAGGKRLEELPWAWIGAVNNDHTPDAPPLADIAYINIKHYQAEADIAEIAHTVGQPTIAISEVSQQWVDKNLKGVKVGARNGLMLPVGGKLSMVQAEDRNLPITVAERREKQMAMLGAKLVERNTSARTATQASDEAQTDNSVLSLCAGNVEQAVNRALSFAVAFAGSGEGQIELNKRYELSQLDSASLTAMMAMVQSGQMRLIDFIRYQQSIGLIDQQEKPEHIEDELRNGGVVLTGGNNGNGE
ncbi:DUF4055 domain-containing protein [Salmonella enterica]|nr:DUF4055 domain-containing protein [Salmonella enterica]EJU2684543.1 DUF4055 domain-containing protein [Salmonella enterica]EJX3842617.1 DUF4055 domain-containing protein [Salmonella enterica]EJX4928069.1 DUF4055 domain-containing protein [Salmonella enterica]